jgi:hypothetical protein
VLRASNVSSLDGPGRSGDARRARRRPGSVLLTAGAVAWLVAVIAIQVDGTAFAPDEIGSSPQALVNGSPGRLLSSSLIIENTLPWFQLALLVAACLLVLVRLGPVVWWCAALAGHVGSALVVYGAIGIADALGVESAERVTGKWDYGISCVFAAQLGVLAAAAARRLRCGRGGRLDVALLAATLAAIGVWFATLDWYGIEHLLAFAAGVVVLLLARRRNPRAA